MYTKENFSVIAGTLSDSIMLHKTFGYIILQTACYSVLCDVEGVFMEKIVKTMMNY